MRFGSLCGSQSAALRTAAAVPAAGDDPNVALAKRAFASKRLRIADERLSRFEAVAVGEDGIGVNAPSEYGKPHFGCIFHRTSRKHFARADAFCCGERTANDAVGSDNCDF